MWTGATRPTRLGLLYNDICVIEEKNKMKQKEDFPIGSLVVFTRSHRIHRKSFAIKPSEEYKTIGLVVGYPDPGSIYIEWIHNSWFFPFQEGVADYFSLSNQFLRKAYIQKPE
jgi:NADPH-dependent 7-cyano-7-deazaguanine reductase QueF